ncbi:hypothetical protein [Leifsonia sp. 1010]|uniref:hypothetical protein n=1 Tax=Leifsonia sp. 1010 TaxID=2817769 RepID=UPI0028576276|nr:hypothetical protein [Leifsonia sp. 1010]MDR6613845.1 hypothetical protein [Leifsonia sp. 1010]
MSGTARSQPAWGHALGWPIAALGIGGLGVWRFTAAIADGHVDGWSLVIGIVGAIALLTVLLGIPAIRSSRRRRLLSRSHPAASVCTLSVYPETAQQLADMSTAAGGETHHMWGNIWAELWCDGKELRVYGGTFFGLGGRPRVLARIPLPHGWTATVGKAQQGLYVMNTLEIRASVGGRTAVINALPVWSAGVVLLPYYKAERIQQIAQAINGLNTERP